MDDATVLDILGRKLMHKDLHDSVVESHEQITLAILQKVMTAQNQKPISREAWLILQGVAKARSQLVPLLSYAEKADSIIVNVRDFKGLNYTLECFKTSVEYIFEHYEELGERSNFHALWSKDNIDSVLKVILRETESYPIQIMREGSVTASSESLQLIGKMFHLVFYAIMGTENYEKFSAESQEAMKILAEYQRRIILSNETQLN